MTFYMGLAIAVEVLVSAYFQITISLATAKGSFSG